MENNEEKTCKNCKYYLEHFYKKNSHLFSIDGHCINGELRAKYPKKRYLLHDNCEYWESNESIKLERRENIKKTLRDISRRLKEISLILKDDE